MIGLSSGKLMGVVEFLDRHGPQSEHVEIRPAFVPRTGNPTIFMALMGA